MLLGYLDLTGSHGRCFGEGRSGFRVLFDYYSLHNTGEETGRVASRVFGA